MTSKSCAQLDCMRFASLLLWLAAGCAESARPPFRPPPESEDQDSGTQRDGGMQGRLPSASGSEVTPEDITALMNSGADLRDPTKICTGGVHSCAIDKDGKVWCWGIDRGYTHPPENLPPQKVVTCGVAHTCTLDDQGVVTCWGAGLDPTLNTRANQGQSAVPEGRYKEVAAGKWGIHTCAIDMSDELVCWGAGSPDRPVDSQANFGQASPPTGKFRAVTAGEAHSCAIQLDNGEVRCWGGEGNGTCSPPLGYACGQLNTPFGSYVQVAAGSAHSCALDAEGAIRCWGRGLSTEPCNAYDDPSANECGQGLVPDDVEAPFANVAAGTHTTCGVTEEYEARCWGWNDFGMTDVRPAAYSQIAPGDLHTCAFGVDGRPVCWGDNGEGQSTPPAEFPSL